MHLAFFTCIENSGGQAGEKEPGSHKKTRRKGERGKNEEEVSFVLMFNCFYLYYANAIFTGIDVCFHNVFVFFLSGPDHAAESTEGMCPLHLTAYYTRARV